MKKILVIIICVLIILLELYFIMFLINKGKVDDNHDRGTPRWALAHKRGWFTLFLYGDSRL